ncbi:MAG TPA: NADH-quinone oxidoreductase subunit NuoF [Candidatus Dormibacteraeota bacterium]
MARKSLPPAAPTGELRGSFGEGRTHLLTRHFGLPGLHTLDVYRGQADGYAGLQAALDMDSKTIVDEVKTSGLRGRGGAGFPTGTKWSFMPPPDGGPRYVVVNADESEPGTSKDRYIMENSPHMLLEGILIAGWGIQATEAWVYIRGEYDRPYQMLTAAIAELRAEGLLGKKTFGKDFAFDIHLYRGHGAYICGEETALLESLEGKRAQPRSRPPFPAVKGAWARPTLLNNVETLSTLPWIFRNGAAEYVKFGTAKNRGTRLVSVSGHVARPGVYEIDIGIPFTELLGEIAGGPLEGHEFKAFWPGGSSSPVLPASMMTVGTDAEALAAAASMAGSGGCMVADDRTCMVEAAHRLLKFYAHESCGKCTPCRVGGNWAVRTFEKILAGEGSTVDLHILDKIQDGLQNGRCLCGLGDSAGWVIMSAMRHFPEEFEEHALHNRCSVKSGREMAASA